MGAYVHYTPPASGGGAPPAGSGYYQPVPVSITSVEVAAKQLTLPSIPAGPVVMFVKGGPPQHSGVDFVLSGTVVQWTGLALDGLLQPGDLVHFSYPTV